MSTHSTTGTDTVGRILSHFPDARQESGGQWKAPCPAHDDPEPSLSIGIGPDGRILINDFGGCPTDKVLAEVGLTTADLYPRPEDGASVRMLAGARGIGERFLRDLGLEDRTGDARYPPSVAIPVRNEEGFIVSYRYRTAIKKFPGQPHTKARTGDRLMPLGLDHLKTVREQFGWIMLVEGETDTLTAWMLGIPALGAPGANVWKPEWAEHLKGLGVFVWVEPDGGGKAFAAKVAASVPEVRLIRPPKGTKDLSEAHVSGTYSKRWFEDLKDRAERSSGGTSGFSGSSGKDSTNAATAPAPVFPIESLPPVSRAYVQQHAAAIGVPPEMVAVPLLVNAAGTIGNTREIELKPGYRQPAVISAAVAAPPGTAKSPAMNAARAPLDVLQLEASVLYQHRLRQWEAEVREAKSRKEKTPPPDPPVAEHYYTTDATIEALALMVQGSPGLVVSRDELVGFIKSMDAYRKGGDRQAYLSLWAGTPLKIDRKTTGTVYVPKPAVSIIGGIQPDLLSELSDESNRQDGFIDRFLMVMPDAGPPKWSEETVSARTDERMAKVFRRMRRPKGYRDRVVLRLSPEARSVFREWYDENAEIVLASTGLEAGCYAKYPNQTARLTLILHLLANPDDLTGPVDADTVRDAITLVEYFRASLARILPLFNATVGSRNAGVVPRVRRILDRAKGEWIDRTTINHDLGGYVKSEAITGALEALQSQGVAETRQLTPGPTGGRPKKQWRSVSRYSESTPEKPEKPEEPFSEDETVADEPDRPFGSPNGTGPEIGVFTPLSRPEAKEV